MCREEEPRVTFSQVFILFQALKPHIPLIRFRKGGLSHATPSASAAAPATATPTHMAAPAASPAGSKADWSPKSTSVDWWQTPNKYRRRELDEIEIEAINVRTKGFRGKINVRVMFSHSYFRWEVPIIFTDDLRELHFVRLFTKNTVVKIYHAELK